MRPLDFNPTDVHSTLLVNRDEECTSLYDDLVRYLERSEPDDQSRTWTIIGDKGIGKTAVTRAVLSKVREEISGKTIIATVDCRERRGWREVLAGLCHELVKELADLQQVNREVVDDSLLTEARLLDELAKLDEATLQTFHQRALGFKSTLKLNAGLSLLAALKAELGLELSIEEKAITNLSGSRAFDEDRLNRAICALCQDVRRAGLGVVIYLDNIDELDHDYHDEEARRRVRRDIEGLLKLDQAPIALVLNMRTYFSQVLPRRMPETIRIGRLEDEILLDIAAKRMEHEESEIREIYQGSEIQQATQELARLAPTPLSFLTWLHFLFRREYLALDKLDEGFSRFIYNHYASLDNAEHRLRRVIELFDRPNAYVDRQRILEACDGSTSLLSKLQYMQVVLPEDFWAPDRYALDPIFQTFHPRLVGSETSA